MQGQSGVYSYYYPNTYPSLLTLDYVPLQLSMRSSSTCAILTGGSLWCWGYNGDFKLGTVLGYSETSTYTPKKIQEIGVSNVSVGENSTCSIFNGALYCWGKNNTGQIGDNSLIDKTTPTPVISGSGRIVTKVKVGNEFSCAIVNGGLWCWGKNHMGQVGVPNAERHLVPVQVFSSGVTDIQLGGAYVCATVKGALYCWGSNELGQVGNGGGVTFLPK